MTNAWSDFNDAKQASNIIPKGTIAKVRMTLRPGGFDDPSQGWTGGYAKRGTTGSVYLDVEYTVLEGPYAKRKIWSMIGLYSPKGPDWANMGRSFIRSVLNSARGLSDKDNSPEAQNARRISGFADLDGIEFVARVDVGTDTNGDEKNDIRTAVSKDHKDYAFVLGGNGASAIHAASPAPTYVTVTQQAFTPASVAQSQPAQMASPAAGIRPTWAR